MSKKNFNLKTYQKIDGDEHIDMRLRNSHEEAPDVVNEKQLEPYRSTESDVTIEKLLEEKRTGEETEITEKRLDTHKSKFANKYRNPATHEGDMNKVEEQRLQGDPVEKEKYEVASKVADQFRWWEDSKSPDGLKLANTEKKRLVTSADDKYEELSFDRPRFESVDDPIEEKVEKEPSVITEVPEGIGDFDVKDLDDIDPMEQFQVVKEKYNSNPNKPELSSIYIILGYDPKTFDGNEEDIRVSALEKVLSMKPELASLIGPSSFSNIREDNGEGLISLFSIGEQFAPIVEGRPFDKSIIPATPESMPVEEISYKEQNIEGTPMAIGLVKVNATVTDENQQKVVKKVIDFIKSKHPEVEIEESSLDLAAIESGEIGYMVGIMDRESPTEDNGSVLDEMNKNVLNEDNDFPVEEKTPVAEITSPITASSDFDIIVESESKKN